MIYQTAKNYLCRLGVRQQQTNNIIMITFWSGFSSYALNTILILFLTRPLLAQGLGFNEAKAYAFVGVTQATGYLVPILGGYMADNILGVRRAIFLGSILLAFAYLFVVLSGYSIARHGDYWFIAAYALLPAANSLLIGTSSSMVSNIYADDAIRAKTAMTFYYMAVNIGALLATILAPVLFDSPYGPLSVLALAFVGKFIAAINFSQHYDLYDNVIRGKDKSPLSLSAKYHLLTYLVSIYFFTIFAYSHIEIASIIIGVGCGVGLFWFLAKTIALSGVHGDCT